MGSAWHLRQNDDSSADGFVVLIPDGLVLYSRPTTALPLKAGSNVIYIHAPGATTLDAADIDAINVLGVTLILTGQWRGLREARSMTLSGRRMAWT